MMQTNQSEDMSSKFDDFVSIIRRLRRECPWDREQTHESIRSAIIEEAYEVVESIDKKDWNSLRGELGDIMLNAVFHAIMAEETGTFTVDDVLTFETEKLIRRHPHVFADTEVDGVDAVHRNWEKIKRKEEGRTSALDGVPAALPALQYAERVQAKAARVGFDFDTPDDAWEKVREELGELDEVRNANDERFESELGDILFAIVNYGRLRGVSPEMALRATNAKFGRRFRHVEARLENQGRSPDSATLEEMDELWDEAKKLERSGDH
jgi:tetrapyrrole methylase family protein/MazG family protein